MSLERAEHLERVAATLRERAEKARGAGQVEVRMTVDELEAILRDIQQQDTEDSAA